MKRTERQRQRSRLFAAVSLVVATLGGISAVVCFWMGFDRTGLGLSLTVCLAAIAAGLVHWAKSLDLDERAVQVREPLAAPPPTCAGCDQPGADPVEPKPSGWGRRRLLQALLGTSLGTLLLGLLGPLSSLAPAAGDALETTGWSAGKRLVTGEGRFVVAESNIYDQMVTAFPEGELGRDDSQIALVRVRPETLKQATVDAGAVGGWVAYSKICTHAGCSIGLFGIDTREPQTVAQLVCPCHQSVFDPRDGARPRGGPATRPLPQLPLKVDGDGHLVAADGFDRPVGPITWTQGRSW